MVGATAGKSASGARVRYLRAGDILEDGVRGAGTEGPVPARGLDAKLLPHDVVVRGRGTPTAATVGLDHAGIFPTNDVLVVRPESEAVDARYVAAFLNLPATRETLSATTQGAHLPRLSVQALAELKLPIPSLAEQRKIVALLDCMRVERDILKKLRELRWQLNQALLHRVMKKAHDEGGNPRREHRQAGQFQNPPTSPHLAVRSRIDGEE